MDQKHIASLVRERFAALAPPKNRTVTWGCKFSIKSCDKYVQVTSRISDMNRRRKECPVALELLQDYEGYSLKYVWYVNAV